MASDAVYDARRIMDAIVQVSTSSLPGGKFERVITYTTTPKFETVGLCIMALSNVECV